MGLHKRQKGFTMVEIIITIAIIGIMAAFAIPSLLSYFPKSRLSGATRVVAGDLMAARMEAVKLNQSAYLQYVNSKKYQAVTGGNVFRSRDLQNDYSDVTINNFGSVKFNSRGAAEITGGNTQTQIQLTNPSGTKTVDVSISGRVKIN